MIIYPIRYQDSVDLESDNDDIITLLNPPEQRMLQSILNNVQTNPDIFIADYFEQDTDVVDEFLANLMLKLMVGNVERWHFSRRSFMADTYDDIIGTLTWGSTPAISYGGLWGLSIAAFNGLEWEDLWLEKGTYIVRIKSRKGNSFGIVHFLFDTVDKTQIDLYNVSTLEVAVYESASFTLDATGSFHVLLQMRSKHASSSNYLLQFQWWEIIRTGD